MVALDRSVYQGEVVMRPPRAGSSASVAGADCAGPWAEWGAGALRRLGTAALTVAGRIRASSDARRRRRQVRTTAPRRTHQSLADALAIGLGCEVPRSLRDRRRERPDGR